MQQNKIKMSLKLNNSINIEINNILTKTNILNNNKLFQ